MTRDELIERMARAAIIDKPHADVCLRVLCGIIPGLSDLIEGRAVVVPKEGTGEMVDAAQRAWTPGVSYGEAHAIRFAAMLAASPYAEKNDDTR